MTISSRSTVKCIEPMWYVGEQVDCWSAAFFNLFSIALFVGTWFAVSPIILIVHLSIVWLSYLIRWILRLTPFPSLSFSPPLPQLSSTWFETKAKLKHSRRITTNSPEKKRAFFAKLSFVSLTNTFHRPNILFVYDDRWFCLRINTTKVGQCHFVPKQSCKTISAIGVMESKHSFVHCRLIHS